MCCKRKLLTQPSVTYEPEINLQDLGAGSLALRFVVQLLHSIASE